MYKHPSFLSFHFRYYYIEENFLIFSQSYSTNSIYSKEQVNKRIYKVFGYTILTISSPIVLNLVQRLLIINLM